MAKRGATSELTDRNWDDEEEPEEAGVFVQADEDTLQQRVIKRAKRRTAGAGDGGAKPAAFGGFGGLTGTSSKGGFAGLKPALGSGAGGFSAFQTMKATGGLGFGGFTPAAAASPVNGGSNNNGTSGQKKLEGNSGSWKDSPAYYSFLKSLNQSVLSWIKQHVEENPYIILTPVFKDYERYVEKHEAENSPSLSAAPSASTRPPTTSSPANHETKDSDSAALPAKADTAKNNVSLFSGIASSKKTEESSETSEETKSTGVVEASKGFAFSGAAASGGIGGFSFGSTTTPKTTTVGSTSTSFGTSSFSFGSATSTSTTTTTPSSGFNFGAVASTAGKSSGFSFGSTSTTASSGFSFGVAAQQAASSSAGAGASNGNNDDDVYVPPKPEVKEVKEDDALYSKRCKLYFQRKDQWVDRGVGNIHLKPVAENKTQILIRADTNLGNILLNVMLSATMPVSRQGKNNVFLVCVPNPPLDAKPAEGDDQSKPVPMLVRVKTGDDADELLKHIDDRKELLS